MSKKNKKRANSAIPEGFIPLTLPYEEPEEMNQECNLGEMEQVLTGLGSLLIQTAAYVMQIRDFIAEAYCDKAYGEEELDEVLNNDVLVLDPEGEQEITDTADCLQRFPWFENVSVFEPVPGSKELYITCDAKNILNANGKKYLTGPAVVIRMEDNPEKEGSVTLEDAFFVMKALSDRYGLLVEAATGKNIKAICIN